MKKNNINQIDEEGCWTYQLYDIPSFMCAGKSRVGKTIIVGADGIFKFVEPGGTGGYQPDYATIELNDEGELAVVDYISATAVEELLENVVSINTPQTITGRKIFTQPIGIGDTAYSDGRILKNVEGSIKNIYIPNTSGTLALLEDLTPETLEGILEGSESVVVDLNEEGDKLQVRLDADIIAKVNRAFLTPIATPTAPELVGFGTDREQKRVKLGSGLSYDTNTDTLSSTGAGTPTYLIVGNLNYQEKTITITSPSYKSAIETFKTNNGYYPTIKLKLNVYAGGTLVQTGEYEKKDAQSVNNALTIWFGNQTVDTQSDPQKLDFSEIVFVDSGITMSATFNDFSTESISGKEFVNLKEDQKITGRKTFTSFIDVEYQGATTQYGKNNIRNNIDENTHYDYTYPNKSGTFAMLDDIAPATDTHIAIFNLTQDETHYRIEMSYKALTTATTPTDWYDVLRNAVEINGVRVYKISDGTRYFVRSFLNNTIEITDIGDITTISLGMGSSTLKFDTKITWIR